MSLCFCAHMRNTPEALLDISTAKRFLTLLARGDRLAQVLVLSLHQSVDGLDEP